MESHQVHLFKDYATISKCFGPFSIVGPQQGKINDSMNHLPFIIMST